MKYSHCNTVLFLLLSFILHAQKIDNTASFRDMQRESYFRINYENDFFTASDIYYTQGYQLELVMPWLRKNPVNHLFMQLKDSEQKYGLLFENLGYIPTSIKEAGIQYGDRPYAATIALKSFMVSTDTLSKSRLSSSLVVGMIGPAALGNEIQTGIHRWIGDDIPQGWHNQIKNDIVLDYELAYEKQLFSYKRLAAINLDTKAHLGTFNTFASLGLNATFGLISTPYNPVKNKKKFSAYIFTQPRYKAIGYDASMQGGIFTRSPYTIAARGIERFVLENNYGIIIQFRTLYFEYFRNDITEEFKTGASHKWGGFKIGFTI
ncbi:outer membrane protein [Flavobacterium rivuli WB 3.3-2 = DSM 21788]|uniref:Outer membrane protein n=1 Tax=Flavobacterium rivuli WB 3.3-2 = DSM 21788 TaxID=1121895 RepID=A0A0A2M1W6_9FLAO|nr:lipid A deacylase LpxR family protein [Flavobacterium rivuli]KGO86617.1 outer membrane protein [Flavobacterium rivuli WB 3.3-2 = DSM 21788]